MNKIILKIGGMSCSACSSGLEKYLNKQKGVINASVNLVLSQALIEYEDNLTIDDLSNYIKKAGYENLGIYNASLETSENKSIRTLFIIFTILAVIILYISMSHMFHLPIIPFLNMNKHPVNYTIVLFILTLPFLIYGQDIFKSGYKNLVNKTPNMDTLVSLGVFSSFGYSLFSSIMVLTGHEEYVTNLYFESSAIVIFFIKLGRFIDKKVGEKTKEALKELVQITPTKALIKVNNNEREITIDEVKKGDILIAKPGMKIAVDGVIVKGETHLDEAFITGEAIPIKKSIGNKVVAGSINHDGFIEYKAEKIGRDSTISEIVRLVIQATNTKAPISHLADLVSGYFVPTIITIAIITFIIYLLLGYDLSEAIDTFVTVLVVACPCALGLATPLAIVVSVGVCAKNGILIKSSAILENAHKIDTIVFDKTGTLTYGNLKIAKIFNYSNLNDDELVSITASIEVKSTHPISKAFTTYVSDRKINMCDIKDFQNLSGIGLAGMIENRKIYIGNNKLFNKLKLENKHKQDEEILAKMGTSIVYVIEDNKVIGLIGVKDIVRDNVKETISKLKQMNKEIIMLTGDNDITASIIAKSVGIKKVISNVIPQEKTKVIKDLIEQGRKVMMVGDGVNDAPALATANIGISFNSGTDIATDSADVILMNDDLIKIVDLIHISQKTLKNIKQNLFWAFFYNGCMIPLAIGILKPFNLSLNPMIAGFAMNLSSFTVILNSLRLKKIKLEEGDEDV